MAMVRAFVPTTLDGLRALASDGAVPAGSPAALPTPGLRALPAAAGADAEELDYLALRVAAADSLRLLAESGARRPSDLRRVVLAVDVPPGEVAEVDAGGTGRVRLAASVPRGRVAAVFVDDPTASAAVGDAVAAGGTPDAVPDVDLLWYATQEIPDLTG